MESQDLLGLSVKGEPAPKFVQDLIPLEDIRDGILCLKDGRYVKVLELTATNYGLKSDSEQNKIINSFIGWLNVGPANAQLKIITENTEENGYAKRLKTVRDESSDRKRRQLLSSVIDHIEQVSASKSLSRKYYVCIEHEARGRVGERLSFSQIAASLNQRAIQAGEYFKACGNSIVKHEDEDIFLGELLYRLLNRSTSRKESYRKRARRVLSDIKELDAALGYNTVNPLTEYANLVAPKGGISIKTSPDYIVSDGEYHSYYYIPASSYPTSVVSAWLSVFENMPGIDIDIFYRKLNKSRYMKRVLQQIKFTKLKAASRSETSSDAADISNAYDSQHYIRQALTNPDAPQDPYEFAVLFSVHAPSVELLEDRCSWLEETAINSRVNGLRMLRKKQELGFKSALPFNYVDPWIWSKAKRNVTTEGLASMYPFTGYELNDDNGVYMGLNRSSGSVITLDIFNSSKYINANTLILGNSGAGKTYTLQLLAMRLILERNIEQVFIITREKGHEFKRLCDWLDGTFFKFSGSAGQNINLFDIRPESDLKDDKYGIDSSASWLLKKSQAIGTWFSLLLSDLSEEEKLLLDNAVRKTYERFGITEDNNSIFIDGEKEKGIKEMPIMSDLIVTLEQMDKDKKSRVRVPERIFNILINFANGNFAGFNSKTNVDLSSKLTVFDVEDIGKSIEAATVHLALDFIWGRTKEDPTRKKAIIIEEAWAFLAEGADESSAKLIQEVFKLIRGYGGAAIAATQQIGDLLGTGYGRTLIECTALKIILGCDAGAADTLKRELHITEEEAAKIQRAEQGQCMLLAGSDRVEMQVSASELEHMIISTKAKDIEKYNKKELGY